MLIECATAIFPYHYAKSYIDVRSCRRLFIFNNVIEISSYQQVVQSIIECAEPKLPEKDASGDPFSPEFHQFVSCCLKKDVRNPNNNILVFFMLTKCCCYISPQSVRLSTRC